MRCTHDEVMDLRKLKHAVILAEEGNYARAARRLNLTQPALSRSIQALEAAMGLKLFDRAAVGVRPNAAGREIVARARVLLDMSVALQHDIQAISQGTAGRLALGLGPMLVPLLSRAVEDALGDGFALDLRCEIEPVHKLAELLAAEKIDLFIADTRHARQFKAFAITSLADVAAGYYARADHPLAGRPDLTLADLADFPLASPDLGREPIPGVEIGSAGLACEDVVTLKRFALTSDAVLLAMGLALEPERSQGKIVRLSAKATEDGLSQVGVVENAGRTRSPAAERIVAAFASALRGIAEAEGLSGVS